MQVIVDYNNVTPEVRGRGLKYIAEAIAHALGPERLGKNKRLHIRLYDGWYQSNTPTHKAQMTSAEVQKHFPMMVTVRGPEGQNVRAVVVTEMAYSLHCDPSTHLWHTFRTRSGQHNVTCIKPSVAGCVSNPCALTCLPGFLSTQRCPDSSCSVTSEKLIVRNEQKLVDTMMAVDLISFHLDSEEELVVVSSDDDLWPPIQLLLQRGHTVYHIHTRPTHRTPRFYSSRVELSRYIQLDL